MVVNEGGGRGEHQIKPQEKEGEVSENQPSHSIVSQMIVDVNMKLSSFLVADILPKGLLKIVPSQ